MQPLGSQQIRGNWATVLLPIHADDSIDYGRLDDEVAALIEVGVDGLYTNGTAGEFHTQSEDEFDRVSQVVAERCERAGMPFQLGVSHPSPQISLARLHRARQWRPSAVQVILPDWVPPSLDEARAFLTRMAQAADPIGLVLYNPPHAKRVLDAPALAQLRAAVPSLVGVKVADGGPSWYGALRHHLADLSVFVPGHHLATGYLNGAQGSYSNVACLSPRGAQRWWSLMQTDMAAALDIERQIIAFFQAHVAPLSSQGYSNPALDKLLAAVGGWSDIGTRLRWPYRYLPEAEAQRLAPVARQMVPWLFE